jgi:hypothetical protein
VGEKTRAIATISKVSSIVKRRSLSPAGWVEQEGLSALA